MSRPLRIFYATGPGDAAGTYRHWLRGDADPRELAMTYSSQMFDLARELGAKLKVVTTCDSADTVRDGDVWITHRPIRGQHRAGVLFHAAQIGHMLRLAVDAWRFRADVVIVTQGVHWWALRPATWRGARLIVSLHRSFWAAGHRPRGVVQRAIQRLNAALWRRVVTATVCVSPECERQVRELTGDRVKGPILQCRAQYFAEMFGEVAPPPAQREPFRLLYAGRIEPYKGVFRLLDIAAALRQTHGDRFVFELAGDGAAVDALRRRAAELGLNGSFTLLGKLRRDELLAAIGRSHAMLVPTTPQFSEGLNKVAVESVLAGRPLLTSRMSNAVDVLGDAVIDLPPEDVTAWADALRRLADDPAYYDALRRRCADAQHAFYDRNHSWGAAIRRCLNTR